MEWAWALVGLALLVAILRDAFVTVFQPSLRGPLSTRVNRGVWHAIRWFARGRAGVLIFGGPLAVLANVALWVGGLVVGWGLLYMPFLDDMSFEPGVDFGDKGLLEAIYPSGVIAVTIGFGDIVAATDALRVVTMIEGAAGAAMLTAALSYVMSVYPIVSEQRTNALRFSDLELQRPDAVAELIRTRGLAPIETLHETLIRNNEQLSRFPVLYYFHPRDEQRSTYALVRGAAMTCAVLRWAPDEERIPGAARYGRAMQVALERTIHDYVGGFVRGLSDEPTRANPCEGRERLRRLRVAAGARGGRHGRRSRRRNRSDGGAPRSTTSSAASPALMRTSPGRCSQRGAGTEHVGHRGASRIPQRPPRGRTSANRRTSRSMRGRRPRRATNTLAVAAGPVTSTFSSAHPRRRYGPKRSRSAAPASR